MDNRYRKEAGDRGEINALRHLQMAGLQLIERNYRCRSGELDLIMLEQQTLVFVEVRYRQDRQFGGAAASVNQGKQRRLLLAAQRFLQAHPQYQRHAARFDVVSLEGDEPFTKLQWLKDAFRS
ncbi:MAG: YraN family protein [Steroidobacteraceae bacterium]